MYTTHNKVDEELVQKTFGIQLNEDEFRFVLESTSIPEKKIEFMVTKFGAFIFNRNQRLVLIPNLSDNTTLCFEFEQEKIKKERDRIRKSCLVKCFEACFFPNLKDSLYLEVYFKEKQAQLFWMNENESLSVVDSFKVLTF